MKPGQRVIVELRRLIASGELRPGERIGEIATAESLGVSRMPVRTALRALEHEGLVVKLGARGYAARGVSPNNIRDAVQVRGVLEGLAARQAAERGLSLAQRRALTRCLEEGDTLFANGCFSVEDLDSYHAMNLRFHATLVDAADNGAIRSALATNNSLPFAAAAALTVDTKDLGVEFVRLSKTHHQHHQVFEAVVGRQPDRAEALMRQHALAALENAKIFPNADSD